MSYNLVNPVTGELTQVAGGIDTSIIPSDASASNKLATTDSTLKTIQLSGSVDCNTLTEPGLYTARAGTVSALTNAPINQAQLEGGFSILVTATNSEGTFFGSQMFIPYSSDLPFIRKAYYFNGQYWTDWEQLATMDNVVKYPDWSNQQTISQTEIVVDQDVYIELNQLLEFPLEGLKINGKVVSAHDSQNGLFSIRFSGYVKKGSSVSYPYLANANIVRVFPLV